MANNIGTTRTLTQSDSTTDAFNMLMVVTTAGTVVFDQIGGNTITLASVPVGVWIPVGQALRVRTASTAVGILVY